MLFNSGENSQIKLQVFNKKEYRLFTKLKFYSIIVTIGNSFNNSFKPYITHSGGTNEYHFYLPYQTINIDLRC